jgi:hypothetical protein
VVCAANEWHVVDDAPMRVNSLILGTRETISGTVYGTIVVLAALTAGGEAYKHDPWRLDVIVAVTVVVLWLAHVYSHGLGQSLTAGRRLTTGELTKVARREFSIPLAALLPIALITLAALDVLAERTALRLALGVGVVTLTAQGIRYARLERLTPIAASVTVAVNLAFGLTIVALEAFVAH